MIEMSTARRAYPAAVDETLTYGIELAVGLGCVAAAVPALRTRRLRWLGVALLVAGGAATAHAAFRLLS
jgi:hypothetical protein